MIVVALKVPAVSISFLNIIQNYLYFVLQYRVHEMLIVHGYMVKQNAKTSKMKYYNAGNVHF